MIVNTRIRWEVDQLSQASYGRQLLALFERGPVLDSEEFRAAKVSMSLIVPQLVALQDEPVLPNCDLAINFVESEHARLRGM